MTFDASQLREVLNSVLDERKRVDEATHQLHHEWVAHRLECDRRRRAIVDKVAQTMLGATGVAALAWLGSKILEGLRGG